MMGEPPRVKRLEETGSYAKFVVEPLEAGFGTTMGNALRRVLLSSVPGAAITSVKIDGVLHEFSTIPGVREDTTALLLNLKDLNIKVAPSSEDGEEARVLRIEAKGKGEVTGADVRCTEDVEIVNPEVYIAEISEETASLTMELTVEVGTGFVLPEQQEKYKNIIGTIPFGSVYTPVRKVNFATEPTRVGNKTNYERLVLEVWTNGTITADDTVSKAAEILMEHAAIFIQGDAALALRRAPAGEEAVGAVVKAPDARIEELDFSVRTYNCLKKAGITNVQDLVQTSEQELMNIRNFGRKSLNEVKDKLAAMDLTLRPPREGEEPVVFGEEEEEEEGEE
ncbi:MAG TPA: DNA-directed RNA polymerase subunit alpha [Armatimonadota bacterium]|jgi:DNA-directed RNA polymerase subunit alpha